MKKFLLKFLILILTFTCFSYAIFDSQDQEGEHDHSFVHVFHIEADEITCPNCGHVALGDLTSPATCTSPAQYEYVCGYCDSAGVISYGSPLGHSYSESIISEATCTTNGLVSYECGVCGDSYTQEVAALGHNYSSKVTKAATCTEDGVRTYTCSRCNDKYTKKIAALGHDIEYEEKEATCTEDGYKKGVCKRCGEETIEVYKALGHDLETPKVTKKATCTEKGLTEGVKCDDCCKVVTAQTEINALGHDWVKGQTVAPTCSAEGYTVYECARCHVTEQRDKTGKVAHVDNNNDGVCDYGCGTEMHQGGGDEGGSGNGGNFFSNLWQRIVSFFQRIGNFFRNLFNR